MKTNVFTLFAYSYGISHGVRAFVLPYKPLKVLPSFHSGLAPQFQLQTNWAPFQTRPGFSSALYQTDIRVTEEKVKDTRVDKFVVGLMAIGLSIAIVKRE